MTTLNELLAPQIIMETVVSRIKQPGDYLQRLLGVNMGGPAHEDDGMAMRYSAYDIFDSVQDAENFRAPGTAPDVIAPNPIGQVPVTIMRMHTKVPLNYEQLGNQRPLGKTSGNVDKGGVDYIKRQEGYLKQRFQNARELMAAALLRGKLYVKFSGDSWIPLLTAAGSNLTIDFQIPAGNLSQLNLLGAGNIIGTTWLDTTNATIFENILAINSAFYQLHGYGLKNIICDSVIWGYVTNNAGIKARSGSANVVFESWKRDPGVDDKDRAMDGFKAVLRCIPWLTWHVYDGGVKVNGTFKKFYDGTTASFIPDPSPTLYGFLVGGEYIQENEMVPATVKRGLNFWPQYVREPSRIEIVGLDNVVPFTRVPKSLAFGTVVF